MGTDVGVDAGGVDEEDAVGVGGLTVAVELAGG